MAHAVHFLDSTAASDGGGRRAIVQSFTATDWEAVCARGLAHLAATGDPAAVLMVPEEDLFARQEEYLAALSVKARWVEDHIIPEARDAALRLDLAYWAKIGITVPMDLAAYVGQGGAPVAVPCVAEEDLLPA